MKLLYSCVERIFFYFIVVIINMQHFFVFHFWSLRNITMMMFTFSIIYFIFFRNRFTTLRHFLFKKYRGVLCYSNLNTWLLQRSICNLIKWKITLAYQLIRIAYKVLLNINKTLRFYSLPYSTKWRLFRKCLIYLFSIKLFFDENSRIWMTSEFRLTLYLLGSITTPLVVRTKFRILKILIEALTKKQI